MSLLNRSEVLYSNFLSYKPLTGSRLVSLYRVRCGLPRVFKLLRTFKDWGHKVRNRRLGNYIQEGYDHLKRDLHHVMRIIEKCIGGGKRPREPEFCGSESRSWGHPANWSTRNSNSNSQVHPFFQIGLCHVYFRLGGYLGFLGAELCKVRHFQT